MADKKLGQLDLLAMEADTFKRKSVTITANGEEYNIEIDTKFKDTEIASVFTELLRRSEYARKASLDFDVTAYILILLIKHFTNLEFKKTHSLIGDMNIEIRTLNALINLGIFEQIIEHFDKDEVNKLGEMFEKHQEGIKRLADNVIATEVKKDAEA